MGKSSILDNHPEVLVRSDGRKWGTGVRALAARLNVDKRTIQRYRAKHRTEAIMHSLFHKDLTPEHQALRIARLNSLRPQEFGEENFRAFVDYLFQAKREGADGFHHAATGLAGESGEVLDHTKKHWVYDRELDVEKVVEEMGDTLHYFFQMMLKLQEIGVRITLKDVMANNVAKLRKRYPDGFSKEAAIARADKALGGTD